MGEKETFLLSLIQGPLAQQWAQDHPGWTTDPSDAEGCNWEGIECDGELQVTTISMSGIGIHGTLPAELGKFDRLKVLDLGGNSIFGTIPEEILLLSNLVVFNVAENLLEGQFPRFPEASELELLVLRSNSFGARIPSDLVELHPKLTHLDGGNNTFTGTIPESITDLPDLDWIAMNFNKLIGTIPSEIGHLEKLKGILLNDNMLVGTIPHTLSSKSSSLIHLILRRNHLSGTVPVSLSEIPNLQELLIDGNKLTGTVPPELCQKNLNQGYFGDAPGAMGRDGCTSIACPINFKSPEGVHPCEPCPNDRFSPYLGRRGGCLIVDQKHILDTLFVETNGTFWKGGDRWNNPSIPHCTYEGVECNDQGNVVNISLPARNLQGSITFKLGRLSHLRVLNLADNNLNGIVPGDLRFLPLEELNLGGNQLQGPLPPLLCLAEGINGNGHDGDFHCDSVACSPGTWHSEGRATYGGSCMDCPGALESNILGSKSCSLADMFLINRVHDFTEDDSLPLFAFIVILLCIAVIILSCLTAYNSRKERKKAAAVSSAAAASAGTAEPATVAAAAAATATAESASNPPAPSPGPYFADEDETGTMTGEELNVVSYATPSTPPTTDIPAASTSTLATGVVRRASPREPSANTAGATNTPAEGGGDQESQDLWLDVPKIP